jgi:hypothetical protein
MATETARSACGAGADEPRPKRGLARRRLLAAAMVGVLAAAAAASSSSLGLGGAAASGVRDGARTPVAGLASPASTQPLILAKRPKPTLHSGKTNVGLFTAIPATVPAAGGSVRLLAVVQSATSCRFTSSKALKPLPATERCASGRASIEVRLPRNSTSADRTYHFQLLASGPRGATRTAPVAVVERASPAPAAAPVISTQPASRSVIAGSNVTFTASASGSASVQWEVSTDGGHAWSNIAGATSDSYSLIAATAESGYDYRALFSSRGGTTPTAAATLTVSAVAPSQNAQQGQQGAVSAGVSDQAPVITMQPVGDATNNTGTATFSASASGAPAPSVQWQDSLDGTNWADISGATSATYSFTATSGENGYEYRAVFTNSAGSATTNAVLLNVVQYAIPPTGITAPLSQTVIVGALITFTSTASGGVPSPTVQWQVSLDGGSTWNALTGPGTTSTSYSFTASISDNGNQYRAEFLNGAAPVYSQPATLTVSVPVAPAITVEPISDNAFVGSAASFTAAATGIPAPSVQWEVSTDGGTTWTAIVGANSPTYTFDPAQDQSGDEFEAVFSNVAGTRTSSPATLTVTVPLSAPVITQQPATQAIVLGSDATFSAQATGNPTPTTVKWQVSTDGGNTWGDVSDATSSSYTFTPTKAESGYEYHAAFTNTQGTTYTDPASLIVGDDPKSTVNWSGYGATAANGTFNSVTGDWTVPTATCPSSAPTYSADWIGIDGDFVSASVEQDGTDSDCSDGVPEYYAWYEMFPGSSTAISSAGHDAVAPGDSMSASVSVSGFTWTLEIQDLSAAWTYSTTIAQSGLQQASAEWIAERPQLCTGQGQNQSCTLSSLADFGSVTFSDATANGASITAPSLGASAIEMTSSTNASALIALPGPLSGSGFTDTWYASS